MAHAVYLSLIVGTGQAGDSFRVKAFDVQRPNKFSSQIPADIDYKPLNTHAMVLIDADDHTEYEKDPDMIKVDKLVDIVDTTRALATASEPLYVKDAGKIPPDIAQKDTTDSFVALVAAAGLVDAIGGLEP